MKIAGANALVHLGYWMLAIVVVGVGWSLRDAGLRNQENARAVDRTLAVLAGIAGFNESVNRAESSHRAFLIHREEHFIAQRDTSLARARSQLDDLRALTADNPAQQDRLRAVDPLLAERAEVMREGERMRRAGSADFLANPPPTIRSPVLSAAIYSLTQAMRSSEIKLLDARREERERGYATALQVLFAVVAGVLLLLVAGYVGLVRAAHARARVERNRADLANSLPGAVVDWSQTYLRSRRYSPWNAARRGYDCERLVLSAGGVISLDLPAPLTRAQAARLHAGIGLCREAGLGRLWINPPLLESFNPGFAEGATDASRQEAAKPADPLIAWLEGQQGEWKVEAEARAEALADAYRKAVESARRYAGVGQGVPFGPSKSQWGRILEAARMQSGQLLFSALFAAGNSGNAIVKDSADGWSIEILLNQGAQWQKLSQWLRGQLSFQANSDARAYAHLIRQLAHRVRDDIDKRRV